MTKGSKSEKNEQTGNQESESLKNSSFEVENPKKVVGNRGLFWINITMLFSFMVANYFIIDSSNNSVELATKNLQAFESNAKLEMRAYLQIKTITKPQFRVGEEIKFNIILVNTGKTPAYNIRDRHTYKYENTSLSIKDTVILSEYSVDIAVLGTNLPKDNIINTHMIPTQEDSIKILNGKMLLSVMGEFVYEDIYGDQHFTRYCLIYASHYDRLIHCDVFNEQN